MSGHHPKEGETILSWALTPWYIHYKATCNGLFNFEKFEFNSKILCHYSEASIRLLVSKT